MDAGHVSFREVLHSLQLDEFDEEVRMACERSVWYFRSFEGTVESAEASVAAALGKGLGGLFAKEEQQEWATTLSRWSHDLNIDTLQLFYVVKEYITATGVTAKESTFGEVEKLLYAERINSLLCLYTAIRQHGDDLLDCWEPLELLQKLLDTFRGLLAAPSPSHRAFRNADRDLSVWADHNLVQQKLLFQIILECIQCYMRSAVKSNASFSLDILEVLLSTQSFRKQVCVSMCGRIGKDALHAAELYALLSFLSTLQLGSLADAREVALLSGDGNVLESIMQNFALCDKIHRIDAIFSNYAADSALPVAYHVAYLAWATVLSYMSNSHTMSSHQSHLKEVISQTMELVGDMMCLRRLSQWLGDIEYDTTATDAASELVRAISACSMYPYYEEEKVRRDNLFEITIAATRGSGDFMSCLELISTRPQDMPVRAPLFLYALRLFEEGIRECHIHSPDFAIERLHFDHLVYFVRFLAALSTNSTRVWLCLSALNQLQLEHAATAIPLSWGNFLLSVFAKCLPYFALNRASREASMVTFFSETLHMLHQMVVYGPEYRPQIKELIIDNLQSMDLFSFLSRTAFAFRSPSIEKMEKGKQAVQEALGIIASFFRNREFARENLVALFSFASELRTTYENQIGAYPASLVVLDILVSFVSNEIFGYAVNINQGVLRRISVFMVSCLHAYITCGCKDPGERLGFGAAALRCSSIVFTQDCHTTSQKQLRGYLLQAIVEETCLLQRITEPFLNLSHFLDAVGSQIALKDTSLVLDIVQQSLTTVSGVMQCLIQNRGETMHVEDPKCFATLLGDTSFLHSLVDNALVAFNQETPLALKMAFIRTLTSTMSIIAFLLDQGMLPKSVDVHDLARLQPIFVNLVDNGMDELDHYTSVLVFTKACLTTAPAVAHSFLSTQAFSKYLVESFVNQDLLEDAPHFLYAFFDLLGSALCNYSTFSRFWDQVESTDGFWETVSSITTTELPIAILVDNHAASVGLTPDEEDATKHRLLCLSSAVQLFTLRLQKSDLSFTDAFWEAVSSFILSGYFWDFFSVSRLSLNPELILNATDGLQSTLSSFLSILSQTVRLMQIYVTSHPFGDEEMQQQFTMASSNHIMDTVGLLGEISAIGLSVEALAYDETNIEKKRHGYISDMLSQYASHLSGAIYWWNLLAKGSEDAFGIRMRVFDYLADVLGTRLQIWNKRRLFFDAVDMKPAVSTESTIIKLLLSVQLSLGTALVKDASTSTERMRVIESTIQTTVSCVADLLLDSILGTSIASLALLSLSQFLLLFSNDQMLDRTVADSISRVLQWLLRELEVGAHGDIVQKGMHFLLSLSVKQSGVELFVHFRVPRTLNTMGRRILLQNAANGAMYEENEVLWLNILLLLSNTAHLFRVTSESKKMQANYLSMLKQFSRQLQSFIVSFRQHLLESLLLQPASGKGKIVLNTNSIRLTKAVLSFLYNMECSDLKLQPGWDELLLPFRDAVVDQTVLFMDLLLDSARLEQIADVPKDVPQIDGSKGDRFLKTPPPAVRTSFFTPSPFSRPRRIPSTPRFHGSPLRQSSPSVSKPRSYLAQWIDCYGVEGNEQTQGQIAPRDKMRLRHLQTLEVDMFRCLQYSFSILRLTTTQFVNTANKQDSAIFSISHGRNSLHRLTQFIDLCHHLLLHLPEGQQTADNGLKAMVLMLLETGLFVAIEHGHFFFSKSFSKDTVDYLAHVFDNMDAWFEQALTRYPADSAFIHDYIAKRLQSLVENIKASKEEFGQLRLAIRY